MGVVFMNKKVTVYHDL